jgi:hypothetical protein
VTEKLLNHVSGTTDGIVAVYQRHGYADEMRQAMDGRSAPVSRREASGWDCARTARSIYWFLEAIASVKMDVTGDTLAISSVCRLICLTTNFKFAKAGESDNTGTKCPLPALRAFRDNGEMPERCPDDHILDRYLPDAALAQREEARENLRRLARLLIRVHERLALDNPQSAIRAPVESALDSESLPTSV